MSLHTFNETYPGLYGNNELHNGLLEVSKAGRNVDNITSSVRNQTENLESILANRIQPQLVELADQILDHSASNQTDVSQLILSLRMVALNVSDAKNLVYHIREPWMQVTITSILSVTRTGSFKLYLIPLWSCRLALISIFFSYFIGTGKRTIWNDSLSCDICNILIAVGIIFRSFVSC